jgi:hypothetical protein
MFLRLSVMVVAVALVAMGAAAQVPKGGPAQPALTSDGSVPAAAGAKLDGGGSNGTGNDTLELSNTDSADASPSPSDAERLKKVEDSLRALETEQRFINEDLVDVELAQKRKAGDAGCESKSVPPPVTPSESDEMPGQYFIPYFQGGAAFGVSPDGKDKTQTGRSVTYLGFSGGVGDKLIFEYRLNWYLDRPDGELLVRDRFLGLRYSLNSIVFRLRLGKEESVGETSWAYLTGTIADPRTLLRNTFARPDESVIAGVSLGKYAQLRGEFNEVTHFRAGILNLHFGPVLFDIGHRIADDDVGQLTKVSLGFKPSIGSVDLGVLGLYERQSKPLTADQAAYGLTGAITNACVIQVGAMIDKKFLLLYTEGGYLPEFTDHMYRNLHLEYQFQRKMALTALFVSCGIAKDVPNLYRVPNLVSPEHGVIYGFCETGVRLKIGRFFDPLWPF